nr:hypothetical protein [Francisella tularensis]
MYVWSHGMDITQFTCFQQVGGIESRQLWEWSIMVLAVQFRFIQMVVVGMVIYWVIREKGHFYNGILFLR